MHVVASFDYSIYLEMAFAELELLGVPKERMLFVPLERAPRGRATLDSIHQSDGRSVLDIGMALGTATSVVTASLGMTLRWGPVYWGLIGAASGFAVGFAIDWLVGRRRKKADRRRVGEVVVVVDCETASAVEVAELLWKKQALGVAIVDGPSRTSIDGRERNEGFDSEEAQVGRRRPLL